MINVTELTSLAIIAAALLSTAKTLRSRAVAKCGDFSLITEEKVEGS